MSDETAQIKSPKDEYEARRAEKLAEREAARGKGQPSASNKKIIWIVLFVIILGLVGWGFSAISKSGQPRGEDSSQPVELQNADHISVGASHPPYNSNPPTSGPHYAKTARVDFYAEEIPDEYLVHNLEHGHVWISYHPRISPEAKSKLKKFSGDRVVVTLRAASEHGIALSSWGRLDVFDLEGGGVPEKLNSDFIKRYLNKGPEKIPPGTHE